MSNEEYLEYIKGQMHLSEEEKEWFEEKVQACKKAKETYRGRGY